MRRRLSTRTAVSIATTLIAAVALVVVLATRGSRNSAQPSGQPAAPQQATRSAPRAPLRPIVAHLNRHARVSVKGRPNSGAPPPVVAPAGTPRSLSTAKPQSADAAAAGKLLVSQLGAHDSAGEPSVLGARCTGGACLISYRVDAHGIGVVFGDQAPLWRLLFTDPRVHSVRMLVYHSNVGKPGAGRLPLFEETCDRSAVPRLAANGWSYAAISQFCRLVVRTPPAAAGGA